MQLQPGRFISWMHPPDKAPIRIGRRVRGNLMMPAGQEGTSSTVRHGASKIEGAPLAGGAGDIVGGHRSRWQLARPHASLLLFPKRFLLRRGCAHCFRPYRQDLLHSHHENLVLERSAPVMAPLPTTPPT